MVLLALENWSQDITILKYGKNKFCELWTCVDDGHWQVNMILLINIWSIEQNWRVLLTIHARSAFLNPNCSATVAWKQSLSVVYIYPSPPYNKISFFLPNAHYLDQYYIQIVWFFMFCDQFKVFHDWVATCQLRNTALDHLLLTTSDWEIMSQLIWIIVLVPLGYW